MNTQAEFWQHLDTEAYAILAVLVLLIIVGFYLIRRLRLGATEETSDTHRMLTNFREMHSRGEITDEEYRTIKSELSQQLQQELKEQEETG